MSTDPKARELARELVGWVSDKLLAGSDFDEIAAALDLTAGDVRVAAAEHDDPPEIGPHLQLTGRAS